MLTLLADVDFSLMDFIKLLGQLGPSGILGVALYYVNKERVEWKTDALKQRDDRIKQQDDLFDKLTTGLNAGKD